MAHQDKNTETYRTFDTLKRRQRDYSATFEIQNGEKKYILDIAVMQKYKDDIEQKLKNNKIDRIKEKLRFV